MASDVLAKYEQICRQVAGRVCAEKCSEPRAVAGLGQPNTPQCLSCLENEFAECLRTMVGSESGGQTSDKVSPPGTSPDPFTRFARKQVYTPFGPMELWQAAVFYATLAFVIYWIFRTLLIRGRG